MVGCEPGVARELRVTHSNIQASQKGRSRVYVQYGKLPGLDRQHWDQCKADNEAYRRCQIERTEDQQSIPPAYWVQKASA